MLKYGLIIVFVMTALLLRAGSVSAAVGCGNLITNTNPQTCSCTNAAGQIQVVPMNASLDVICCGWKDGVSCSATDPTAAAGPASCGEVLVGPQQCNCQDTAGGAKQPELMASGQYCCGWYDQNNTTDQCRSSQFSYSCGSTVILNRGQSPTEQCNCPQTNWFVSQQDSLKQTHCCGWFSSTGANNCSDLPSSIPPPDTLPVTGGPGGGTGGGNTGTGTTTPPLNIFQGPSAANFAALNPLKIFESPYADEFSSPAGIINRALLFIFPLAGLILFAMIVWGGFEMITGATNSKSMQEGKQRITAALIGFFILFASFWIIQIVEYIFNLAIL